MHPRAGEVMKPQTRGRHEKERLQAGRDLPSQARVVVLVQFTPGSMTVLQSWVARSPVYPQDLPCSPTLSVATFLLIWLELLLAEEASS